MPEQLGIRRCLQVRRRFEKTEEDSNSKSIEEQVVVFSFVQILDESAISHIERTRIAIKAQNLVVCRCFGAFVAAFHRVCISYEKLL